MPESTPSFHRPSTDSIPRGGSGVTRYGPAPWCAAALALLALAAAGCGDTTGEPEESASNDAAAAAGTAVPIPPREGEGLIAPPDIAFTVAFDWDQPGPTRTDGILVWQQGNGVRRWDWVSLESGTPARGDISIERDPAASEALPYRGMGCMWWVPDTGTADVSCGQGSYGPPFGFLSDAIWPYATRERIAEQTIAGRTADCYSMDVRGVGEMVLCVDPSQGIPLRLSVTLPGHSLPALEMRALSVSVKEQNLAFPIELEYEPVTHGWQFEGTVPFSTLQLPDLSQFED